MGLEVWKAVLAEGSRTAEPEAIQLVLSDARFTPSATLYEMKDATDTPPTKEAPGIITHINNV